MAISSRKITTYADNMKDLPVIPNIPGTEVLAKMDGRTDNEVKNSINGIVDDLVAVTDGASGADQVGATLLKAGGAATVQGQLEELKADKVEINASITGATKCKITYDVKGLVTGGTDLAKTDLPSEAITTDNVIQEITGASRTDKVISEKAYNDKQIVIGAADMLQSTYDTQGKHTDAFNSANHSYSNLTSGLTAVNTQTAIDETVTLISNVSEDTTKEIEKLKINALLTDLQLSANSANIDAWCDLLGDTSLLNMGKSIYIDATAGKLKAGAAIQCFNGTDNFNFGRSGDPYSGQTFTSPSYSTALSKVIVRLQKTASPTDNVSLYVYATSGGLPTGSPIATSSNAISGSSLTTSFADCEFTFSGGASLTPNTLYAFVYKRSGAVDASNYYSAQYSSTSVYSGGTAVYFNGSIWQSLSTADLNFKLYYSNMESIAYWNAVTSSEVLSKTAVAATQTVGTGTISWYLSDNNTTWVPIANLKQMYATNFTTTSVYLKCVITGNAEIDAVAFGG